MKTIGLLGGISWESTSSYYKSLNQKINKRLGGLHSAKIVMTSVDFEEISQLQHRGEWDQVTDILAQCAESLESAGADGILICANTIHKVADGIMRGRRVPLLHMVDAMGQKLVEEGIQTVGLLGTRFTMAEDFYKDRMKRRFNVDVVVPNEQQQSLVHDVIYDELCLGVINQESKQDYLQVINSLAGQGAEAVILGCTEIAMLVNQNDTEVPLLDSLKVHVDSAIEWCLQSV